MSKTLVKKDYIPNGDLVKDCRLGEKTMGEILADIAYYCNNHYKDPEDMEKFDE